MDKKFNLIYALLSALIVVVFIQGYIIYDFKDTLDNKVESTLQNGVVAKVQDKDKFLNNFHANSSEPFEHMKKMQEEMLKSFGHFNSVFANDPFFQDAFSDMGVAPLSDFKDNDKAYILEINIPGVTKNNINVTIKNNNLHISAISEGTNDVNNSNYIHKERYSQRFERSFSLPNDADSKSMTTNYKNGVLKIVIPKNK